MAPRALITDGWTPRRRGAIYCSPRCGGNCTQEDFRVANAKASRLAKRMGPGWRPVVWENLGWHARIEKGGKGSNLLNGRIEICFDPKRPGLGFTAWIQTSPQFIERGPTPELALDAALKAATQHALEVVRAITAAGAPLNLAGIARAVRIGQGGQP